MTSEEKIVPFPGKKREGPKKETPKPWVDVPSHLYPGGQDLTQYQPNQAVGKALEKAGIHNIQLQVLGPMKEFLDSLEGAGAFNRKNIDLRQIGLDKFSDDELREMARNSTKTQWKEKPSFYYALIEEIRARNLL